MATETKNLNKLTKNLGKYLDQDQLEQVKKAYFFAANAHSGQFRVSGDPYVSHPLAVTEILGKLKMDQDCLNSLDPSLIFQVFLLQQEGAIRKDLHSLETDLNEHSRQKSKPFLLVQADLDQDISQGFW